MIQKEIDLNTPMQSLYKSMICSGVFCIQKYFPFEVELDLSAIPLFKTAFIRIRDVIVSESLKVVYYPIPKSACTLFITMLALFDSETTDFVPEEEGIHRYRFRKSALRPKNLSILNNNNYFRFTVIRNPFERIVSGYVDKFVKPFIIKPDIDRNLATTWTLRKLIEFLSNASDSQIDKHWRPQYLFFKNVELDYIGTFEYMNHVYDKLRQKLNIDIETQVATRIYKKARTNYTDKIIFNQKHVSELIPLEFVTLGGIPRIESFLNEDLRAIIRRRYAEDLEIYEKAKLVNIR